jgi:alginate O-acetyltransferase complex protein AlgI
MLFNSYVFLFAFLPITYAVFWMLRTAQSRYLWLTVTGYVFYGWWDPRFCLLMAFSTLVSFVAGLGFLRWSDPGRRRLCLILPITVDLLLLGVFKYADFTLQSGAALLRTLGLPAAPPELNIVLPVGISFYTFHTISYIVDCYRGQIRPTRNLLEFTAYVSLFSQLVAGPIVRFSQLERDLENLGGANRLRWRSVGISLFLTGLIEKVLIADSLANWIDPAFENHAGLSTASSWLAMCGYSLQLYFDFSGYSTMAAGLGFLFGLRIPQNFNSPYQACNPADFWKRWHISLSTCMRDYLFIPLGGSRGSDWLTARNLLLTMLIGGLWHGANWTFVVWGFWHGFWLVVHRFVRETWSQCPVVLQRFVTLQILVIGWVFFRSEDFAMASSLLKTMFVVREGEGLEGTWSLCALLLMAGAWALLGPNPFELHASERPRYYSPAIGSFVFGVILALIASWQNSPFLYFQF